jgi:glutamate racemase
MNASLPIGVFDSGVGGLTVLRAIHEQLPNEQLVYLGDTARVPYGTKSPASVQRYALHAAEYLVQRGIKLLVVACNTASALALDELRLRLAPIPVIGVVEPGAAAAVALSHAHRYVVLATEATTQQRAYTQAIAALDSDAHVEELACSLFVALAEEGWHEGAIARSVADQYLSDLRNRPAAARPDAAILGCTHFPLLAAPIAAALGPDIAIVDSASTTAAAVAAELQKSGLAAPVAGSIDDGNEDSNDNGIERLTLIATDGAVRFARVGSAFLGKQFTAADIELIDIHPSDLQAR